MLSILAKQIHPFAGLFIPLSFWSGENLIINISIMMFIQFEDYTNCKLDSYSCQRLAERNYDPYEHNNSKIIERNAIIMMKANIIIIIFMIMNTEQGYVVIIIT